MADGSMDGRGDRYPPYVTTEEHRRRWDLSVAAACQALQLPEHTGEVWQATRALYWSDIPTDPG